MVTGMAFMEEAFRIIIMILGIVLVLVLAKISIWDQGNHSPAIIAGSFFALCVLVASMVAAIRKISNPVVEDANTLRYMAALDYATAVAECTHMEFTDKEWNDANQMADKLIAEKAHASS